MTTNGRVALVTGAGSGIGRAAALALLKDGYRVVLAGRRQDALEATQQLAGVQAEHALPVSADVTRPEQVSQLFERTRRAFGRLDVLFNNAGRGGPPVPLEDVTFEQWQAVVSVNQPDRHMANLPLDANILVMTIMATKMPYVGRG